MSSESRATRQIPVLQNEWEQQCVTSGFCGCRDSRLLFARRDLVSPEDDDNRLDNVFLLQIDQSCEQTPKGA